MFHVQVSGTVFLQSTCLGDSTDGAATLALHGLPHFQLSGDPPPDALQIQASVKLSSTQGNAKKKPHICVRI